jgi:hypothetical protein
MGLDLGVWGMGSNSYAVPDMKFLHKQSRVSTSIVMVEKPSFIVPFLRKCSLHIFPYLLQNKSVDILIHSLSVWDELAMHNFLNLKKHLSRSKQV